jgi:hypothetical protein
MKKNGKTYHIPSFSKTCSPWTVCTFCVILEQGKCVEIFLFVLMLSTKKGVISEQHKNILIFLNSTNFENICFFHCPKLADSGLKKPNYRAAQNA